MRCKVCWLFQERQNREGSQITENHHGRVSFRRKLNKRYKCPELEEKKSGCMSKGEAGWGGKSRTLR